jgi:hypothetical protein
VLRNSEKTVIKTGHVECYIEFLGHFDPCRVKVGRGKDKGKVVPVLAMKAYRWKRGTAPHILNLGTRWVQLVSFTPCPLYLWGMNTVPLNRRSCGLQSQSKHAFGADNLLPLPGIEPWIIHPVA